MAWLAGSVAQAANIYIAPPPLGNDALGTGAIGTPYATFVQAISVAVSGADTVIALDGTYTGVGNRSIDFLGKAITVTSQNGAAFATVDCQGLGEAFIFQTGEAATSILTNLTITNGRAQPRAVVNPQDAAGGAIFIQAASPTLGGLVITNSRAQATVTGNDALGGAIYCATSTASISDCTFIGNQAVGGPGDAFLSIPNGAGQGGAIFGSNSALTITGCAFQGNRASGGSGNFGLTHNTQGGAIRLGGAAATLTAVRRSVFRQNSVIGSNTGQLFGGGGAIFALDSAAFLAEECEFDSNAAQPNGGSAFFISAVGTSTIKNSLVANNYTTTTLASGGNGAFQLNNAATILNIVNTTMSENRAVGPGRGGAIFDNGATINLLNCTLNFNSAATAGNGGGIYRLAGTVNLKNSIVANSPSGGDVAGAVTSQGHNIISDATLVPLQGTDLASTNPLLGPLANNGGLTRTHALLVGSPAIDSADGTVVTEPNDQRGAGFPRQLDGDGNASIVVDRGAYEYLIPPTPTPTATPTASPAATSSPSPSATPSPLPTLCQADPAGDTAGYTLGGGWGVPPYPPVPVNDPEVDIQTVCVADDCAGLYVTIQLGPYAGVGSLPNVQLALDSPVFAGTGPVWFNPTGTMAAAPFVGANGPFMWDVLVATDLGQVPPVANLFFWTGVPTPIGTAPVTWTPGTGTIQINLSYAALGIPLPQGVPVGISAMAAHSMPSGAPGGVADAPLTDPDDVLSINPGVTEFLIDAPNPFSDDYQYMYTVSGCPPTPTPTATPTASETPSATPTASLTASLTPSATPTASLTASLTPSATPTASLTPSATPTASLTPSATPTASLTASLTPSATPTPTVSASPTATLTASLTASETPSATPTASLTPSVSPTPTASETPSLTPSPSLTATQTPTATPTPFAPTIFVDPTAQSVGENAGPAVVRVRLSAPTTVNVLVDYQTADVTASAPGDYTALPLATLTFLPGDTLTTVPVTIVNDPYDEIDEDFEFRLSMPVNGILGTSDTQTITILDDDPEPTVGVSVAAQSVGEAAGPAIVFVQLSTTSTKTITVDYTTANGSAIEPGDYGLTAGTLTFNPGEQVKPAPVPIVSDAIDEIDEDFVFNLSMPVNATPGTMSQTITIVDDDPAPTVSVSAAGQSIGEAAGPATVTVELSVASEKTITVEYFTADGTAAAPGDYGALAVTTLTFLPGEVSKPILVGIVSDAVDENDETFDFNLQNASNATLGLSTHTITILDDDPEPTISVVPATQTVGEAVGTANATIELSAASEKTITVEWYTQDGSALQPGDYTQQLATLLTFNPGVVSIPVGVPVIDDLTNEATEDFTIRLQNPTNATIALAGVSGTVNITDNDSAPTVSVVPAAQGVLESAGTATVVVQLSAASGVPISVDYRTFDGTAVAPGDYTALALTTLNFAPGETSKNVSVTIANDLLDENNEDFTFVLSNPTNTSILTGTQTITIQDDDPLPVVRLTAAAQNIGEAAGPATVTIELSAPSGRNVTVEYLTMDGTALAPGDYGALAVTTLTFLPGEVSKPILVGIVSDAVDEFDETFDFKLQNPANATLGTATQTVTIQDDDAPPSISIVPASQSIAENAGPVSAAVELSAASEKTITVQWFTQDGSALQPGDYTQVAPTVLTFNPGVTSLPVSVAITNDATNEPNEDFRIRLQTPVNASISVADDTVTIIDDDAAPTVSVVPNAQSLLESAGVANVTVQLSAASGQTITVDYRTFNGTAIAPGDYTALPLATLTFLPTETVKVVPVAIINDLLDENDEDFTFVLSNPTNTSIVTGTQTITIQDNDPAPTVQVSVAAQSVAENLGPANVVVTLSAPSEKTVTVDYITGDMSAVSPADYTALPLTTLTFNPLEVSKTVPVALANDLLDENNEDFTFTLSNAANATLGASVQTVTILDDDPLPTVSVQPAVQTVPEAIGSATVAITLDAPSGRTVTVNYTTLNGSALQPGDYTLTSGVATFNPGVMTVNIPVPIIDDLLDEPTENLTFTLSAPVNANLGIGGGSVQTINIDDNDAPPNIRVNPLAQSVNEGAGPALVTIELDAPSEKTVTVQYDTGDVTAFEPFDYTLTTGIATFPPGTVSVTIPVPIIDDPTNEAAEDFTFTISAPANATLTPGADTQTITIIDNDPPPIASVNPAAQTIGEAAGPALVTIELSTTSSLIIRIDYTTNDVTAFEPFDYTLTAGTVTFLPGETTKTVPVPIVNDAMDEDPEDFTFDLFNPVNCAIGVGTQTITIDDDDPPVEVRVNPAAQTVSEAAGSASVTIELGAVSGRTVTVDYTTADVSAFEPFDYTLTAGQVTFLPGQTTKTVLVPIYNDGFDEFNEDLEFSIFNPVHATLGLDLQTITIDDDDPPPVVSLTVAAQGYSEGDGNAVVTIDLSTTSSKTVSVDYATGDVTAFEPFDYASTFGTLTFAPGEKTKTILVPIIDDPYLEFDEDFEFSIFAPVNATVGLDLQTITIEDNDPPPVVQFSVAAQTVGEGAGSATVFVDLLTTAGVPVQVDYMTMDGTALQPADYASASGTLLFNPGEGQKTILIPIVDDPMDEPLEDFSITLKNPVNLVIGPNGTETISIDDNDPPPTVEFSQAGITVLEDVVDAIITVRLSAPSAFAVQVNYATQNGTAAFPNDYFNTSGLLTFPPGLTVQTFLVPISNDLIVEPDEVFTINLFNEVNSVLGAFNPLNVTILDDDVDPGPYGPKETVYRYPGDGRDPGQFGQSVVDSAGNVHAAYYEAEKGDLKYAYGARNVQTGEIKWSVQTVDSSGDVGRYCSIAVMGTNAPVISYHDETNGALKVAWDKNLNGKFDPTPAEIFFLDASSSRTGLYTSIAIDTINRIHLAYQDDANGVLRFAYHNGASWSLETVPTLNSTISGRFAKVVLDTRNPVTAGVWSYIFFQDGADFDLECVSSNSLSPSWFSYPTIDAAGDTGFYIDAVQDVSLFQARILVSYQDAAPFQQTVSYLKYATFDSALPTLSAVVQSCTPVTGFGACPPATMDGDWGYHTSIALDGNNYAAIAHYDNQFGNMIVERRTTDTYNPPLPSTQIWEPKRRSETAGDVGKYTDSYHAAYPEPSGGASLDTIGINFYDVSHQAIRLDTVVNDVVTSNTGRYIDGPKVGEFSSLALDTNEFSVVAYYDNPEGSVYIARRSGPPYDLWEDPALVDDSSASRARIGDYSLATESSKLARTDFSQTGEYVSLVMDSGNVAHIAYYDRLRKELNYSIFDFATSGSQRLDVDRGRLRGEYASMARNPITGQYAIAYYQALDPNYVVGSDPIGNGPRLRVAFGDGLTSAGWTIESVDNVGDVGKYCSIAYTAGGQPHVAYYNATTRNLMHAYRAALGGWFIETVENTLNADGLYTSIAINPATQQPAIAYYDLFDSSLKYAEYNGLAWAVQTVDDVGDVGLYPRLCFDTVQNLVYIVYHDASFEGLKSAVKAIFKPTFEKIDAIETGGVGRRPSIVVDSQGFLRISYYDIQKGDLVYRQALQVPFAEAKPESWLGYE